MPADLTERMRTFVTEVLSAMGLPLDPVIEEQPDCIRIQLEGEEGEVLLRRKGAGLDALQHMLNTVFRRELPERQRIVVDYLDYRQGKDAELRQTALFLADQAKQTCEPQEIGPLNAYARRIVHLAVAEDPAVSSESHGDALLKTVIISAKSGH